MNSEKMKSCLVEEGYKNETKADRDQIQFKQNEIYLKDLPLGQRAFEAPQYNEKEKRIGTCANNHNVGQLQNNMYKLKKALNKTKFNMSQINESDFEEGHPSAILKAIHHFLFRASECFTNHIMDALQKRSGVTEDVKFLPDIKFFKCVSLLLSDLFGYRINIDQKQFFQEGFSERKIILILDIYDILKNVRKNIRINKNISRVIKPGANGVIFASDEAQKSYSLINHQEQVQKSLVFKMNIQLQTRQLTVVEQLKIDQQNKTMETNQSESLQNYIPLRQNNQNRITNDFGERDTFQENTLSQNVLSREFQMKDQQINNSKNENVDKQSVASSASSVYSLSRHHEKKVKRQERKNKQNSQKQEESENKEDIQIEQNSLKEQAFNEEEMQKQILMMLSNSINKINIKYEEMGERLTQKLENLESTSKNIQNRFLEFQNQKEQDGNQSNLQSQNDEDRIQKA